MKEITPLIEFIRDKKAEKVRMREERMDARRKRDDDRRKVREEERKRRKENAEKNFLEMMNEKIKADDAADERPKEEKSRVRDSAKGGGGSDKDRNRAERFPKDGENLNEIVGSFQNETIDFTKIVIIIIIPIIPPYIYFSTLLKNGCHKQFIIFIYYNTI